MMEWKSMGFGWHPIYDLCFFFKPCSSHHQPDILLFQLSTIINHRLTRKIPWFQSPPTVANIGNCGAMGCLTKMSYLPSQTGKLASCGIPWDPETRSEEKSGWVHAAYDNIHHLDIIWIMKFMRLQFICRFYRYASLLGNVDLAFIDRP